MMINNDKHKQSWRVQKGCRVEWFSGSKKGSGVVSRIVSSNGPWGTASEAKILDDATNTEITVSVDQLRIVKTQNNMRKNKR